MSGPGAFGGGPGFGDTGDVTPDADLTLAPVAPVAPQQPTDAVDLQLDVDGDLVVDTDVHFTSGLAAVEQDIRINLLTFAGEWFRNLDEGVRYLQDILGQRWTQASERKARTGFRRAVANSYGVNKVLELGVTFDASTREMTVSWKAQTIFGLTEDALPLEV